MSSAVLNIEPEHLTATLLNKQLTLTGVLNCRGSLTGIISRDATTPYYEGEYVVEPLYQEDTVLQTAGFVMAQNVVLKRIPKNYGLITWNGVVMTVS